MKKNRKISIGLASCSVACGLVLVLWAFIVPIGERREADVLVREARELLSPPVATLRDVNAVDCSAAERLLRSAVELVPSHGVAQGELHLAEGCAALLRGDLVLAEGSLRSAARRLDGDPRPQRWLGSLAMARGDHTTAHRHFLLAIERDAGDVPARIGLSDALAELGRYDEALEALAELEGPPLAMVELRRGMIYEALERIDDARQAYRRSLGLSPDLAEARNNLAALERDAGNLDLAWEMQREAIAISPDDPLLLLNGGLLAIRLGLDDEASRLLRRAMELDLESADPARALADHLLVTGHPSEALDVLGNALERAPRDAALRNSLGNALAAVGRIDEARASYEEAITIDDGLAEPHNGLAALMLAEGDLAGAEEALRRAVRADPANVHVRRNLAELYRRRGERERAEREQRLTQALRSRSTR